ncbi:MAG TPA: hypothetical protein VF290_06895 [Pyrinomonadaceae bacterium]
MNRLLVCLLLFAIALSACSSDKTTPASNTNQSAQSNNQPSPAKPTATAPTSAPASADGLQPGQASGSYTAKGEVVELKYAYAGRAVRFGTESMVVLVTEKPIPAEAVAEEIKSTAMLEGEKLRGLEYVLDENSMWVRFHPGQYQESTSNKLKEYKVENDVVRGIDENDGSLTDGKYKRSVKFVAAMTK